MLGGKIVMLITSFQNPPAKNAAELRQLSYRSDFATLAATLALAIALFFALACAAFGQASFTDRVTDMWKAGDYAGVMEIARQRLANDPDDMPGLLLELEYEIEYLRLDSVTNTAACILQVAPRIQTPRFSEFRNLVTHVAEVAMWAATNYPPEQYAIDIQKVGTITNKTLGSAFALQALEDDGLFNYCPGPRQTEQPPLVPAPAEVPAFAAPDFDDSSWQTTVLPPADASRPWPDGFNGVIWYRRTFELENDLRPVFHVAWLALGQMTGGYRVFVNGKLLDSGADSPEIWWKQTIALSLLHQGANSISVEMEVENGSGGIQGEDALMFFHLASFELVTDSEGCFSTCDSQWEIPLSGPWKYLLLPSPATP